MFASNILGLLTLLAWKAHISAHRCEPHSCNAMPSYHAMCNDRWSEAPRQSAALCWLQPQVNRICQQITHHTHLAQAAEGRARQEEQGTLEAVIRQVPTAGGLAIADNTFLQGPQGPPEAVRARSNIFCEGTVAVGLEIARDKCAPTGGGTAEAGSPLAADLGVSHSPDGVVAARMPVGSRAFVAQHVSSRAEASCKLIDDLRALPVRVQPQFLLPRLSLAPRLAHVLFTVLWERAAHTVRCLEVAVHDAASPLQHVPQAVGGVIDAGAGADAAVAARRGVLLRRRSLLSHCGTALWPPCCQRTRG
jgi:hypothetical protein